MDPIVTSFSFWLARATPVKHDMETGKNIESIPLKLTYFFWVLLITLLAQGVNEDDDDKNNKSPYKLLL